MDLNGISEILRMLPPRQEKVIRLYFGLGCQRPHSALEIAQAFEVSSQVIAGILGASQRRLAGIGLTAIQIREAARWEAQPGVNRPAGD
jgi:DNA-directed RNA polymerase sigma subunit (sigma70/sigma32)